MSDPATPPVEEAPRRACTRHHPTPDSACGWCDTATNEYRRATRNYAAARPVSGDTEGLREQLAQAIHDAACVPDDNDECCGWTEEWEGSHELPFALADAVLAVVQPLLDQAAKDRAAAPDREAGIFGREAEWSRRRLVAVEAALAARTAAESDVRTLCDQAEANPVGWGGPMVVSFARSVRAALASTTERPDKENGGRPTRPPRPPVPPPGGMQG